MIIAVDFDGTIVEHEYPRIGKQIPFAFDALLKLKKDGHQLIMWTIREGELLDEAVNFCLKNKLEFDAINQNTATAGAEFPNSRKINVDLFIDDRNLGGLPDWGTVYHLIESGEIFQGFEVNSTRMRRPTNVFIRFGEFLQRIIDEPVK